MLKAQSGVTRVGESRVCSGAGTKVGRKRNRSPAFQVIALRRRTSKYEMFEPSPSWPDAAVRAPPECEQGFRIKKACKTFNGAFFCGMEWDEWQLVNGLVTPQDTVLELGGRFGTTSCVIARRTGNTGNVVSVEPDRSVHRTLLANRDRHNCSFAVVKGVVGDTPLALSREFGHYATQTRDAKPGERGALPTIDVVSLEQRIGRPFTTLLIDCEGCIEQFFKSASNRKLLQQVRLILMEEDVPHKVDYRKWHHRFRHHGFERVWKIRDTFEPTASWSRNISHTAWRRGGLGELPSCEAYRKSAGLSPRWLDCLDPASDAPMLP